MSDRVFSPGTMVGHEVWGVGFVSAVTPDGLVTVDFQDKLDYRTSSADALRSLKLLPSEGLAATYRRNPERVTEWTESAQLMVIGLALVDLHPGSDAAGLRNWITKVGLLKGSWSKWWKVVNPAVQESPNFEISRTGSLRLLTNIDDIPEIKIVGKKKVKATPAPSLTTDELLSGLIEGKLKFRSMTAPQIRSVVVRANQAQQMESFVAMSIKQPFTSYSTRTLATLLEALRNESLSAVEAWLSRLVNEAPLRGSRAKPSEPSGRYLDLLFHQLGAIDINQLSFELQQSLLRKLPELWSSVRSETSSKGLAKSVRIQQILVELIAIGDARSVGQTGNGSIVSDSIMTGSIDARRFQLLLEAVPTDNAIRIGCIVGIAGPEAHLQVSRDFLKSRVKLSAVVSELQRFVRNNQSNLNSGAAQNILHLVFAFDQTGELDEIDPVSFGRFVVDVYSNVENPSELTSSMISDNFARFIKGISSGLDVPDSPKSIADVLAKGAMQVTADAQRRHDRALSMLSAQINELNTAVAESVSRTQESTDQLSRLRNSFHEPQEIAQARGQREVLEEFGAYYQELAASQLRTTGSVDELALAKFEHIMGIFGVVVRGKAGEMDRFNPAVHRIIAGRADQGASVRILAPTLFLKSRSDQEQVLLRAQVVPE